jgi:anthranilate phosphoribosyltransferase
MKKILSFLFENKYLTRQEAEEVLTNISLGKYNECEIAAFLTVFVMRRITVEELSGFRDALLNQCIRVDLSEFETIDLCGTGGDGKNTFNISTLTSFVTAGAGVKVAKHGNYAVSSACGSSNILEYFGYKFSNDHDKLRREIDKTGICFLHAPLFNPAMKNVAPVRKQLGIKTFFNMLGPMVNPSFPQNQIVGVFNLELARLYNYIYQHEPKNYIIYHSLDGYDEISLTSDFKVISKKEGERILSPADLGFEKLQPEDVYGGSTVEEAAKIFANVLENKGTTAQMNVIVANSAFALKCALPQKSLEECKALAIETIESGKAIQVLKQLIALQP